MTLLVLLATLFLFLALGMPVGFAMAVAGIAGLYMVGGIGTVEGVLATAPISGVNSYELTTIPMFLLMAEMVLVSGAADGLFRAGAAWLGRIPGGLGMATALAGAGFGAICGTSTASAATLSSTSLPAMLKQGYEPRLASGAVAISGTLATLIPPSVSLVVYGLLADVNIGKLLIAGIIPGLIVTAVIMATIWLLVMRDPSRAPISEPTPWREKVRLLSGIAPVVVLFGSITGVIYSGIATPTEASAIGAVCSVIIALPQLTFSKFLKAGRRALYGSCMILMIVLGAHIFSYGFALTHLAQDIVAWISALEVNRWLVMILILAIYIVLGAFMDQLAILVLTIPVIIPLVKSLGFDLVWFGILKVVVAEIGLCTPPIGLNCHVVARYANRPVMEVFHGIVPHFIAHLFVIALFLVFPGLVLWLPSQMR